ncbi:MAG TPA: T9SS type A sorting domain-containing protein, partial [Bacteroidia bacterium]|nr:T9SS type A sorting domain-containing protein [Bacteroidia bacterium]
IRKVNISTGIITTIAGNGYNSPNYGGYSGDGGPATSAELYYPRNLTVDAAGDIYIADINNNRVRKVIPNTFTTGINKLIELDKVSVFPNPFTNSTTIAMSTAGHYYLELYDITGRTLKQIEFIGNEYILSAEGFAKGMYLVRITDKNNIIIGTIKIVVQ